MSIGLHHQDARRLRVEDDIASVAGLTIDDFLRLPITIQGMPEVVTGRSKLHRAIRWVHVIELADTQGLLEGGELILATGVSLPQSSEEIAAYIGMLADQGVAGLVIELGRRFDELPGSMVKACQRRDLPLIVLRREVPFIKMTEAAHTRIIVGQQRLLRETTIAHERFTALTLADGSVDDLVEAAAQLAGGQVVFANLMHHVIAFDAGSQPAEALLTRWLRRSGTVDASFGTTVDDIGCSIITPVEVRGRRRGRLVFYAEAKPTPVQVVVIERAAAALSIRLLLEDDDALVSHARRTALADIIDGRYGSEDAMHARTGSLGHATRNAFMVPVVVLSARHDIADVIKQTLSDIRLGALVAQLGRDRWGVLLLLKSNQSVPAIEKFADRVHRLCERDRPTIATGAMVTSLAEVGRSFTEAVEVGLAASSSEPFVDPRLHYGIHDIQLRGLLYTLRNDPRVQSFVDRTIGPLIEYDAREGGDWVRTVALYLKFRGNKSLTAQELGISRPTLYERLARIQRMLAVDDIDDPESSTSLYACIMVAQALTGIDESKRPAHDRGRLRLLSPHDTYTLSATDARP